jgi:hypothetical protein
MALKYYNQSLKALNSLFSITLASTLATTSLILLVSCSPQSPKLLPRLEVKLEKVTNTDTRISFNPQVDILFVVDDSISMDDKQRNLAANIQLFTSGVTGMSLLDYHIGVITTSLDSWSSGGRSSDGRLVGPPRFVDRNTPNAIMALQNNLQVGTNGSTTEKMFAPVVAALSQPLLTTTNKDFFRPDAHLALIFITDAEDQSEGLEPDAFYQFLLDLKNLDKKKLLVYGVHIPSIDDSCSRSGEDVPVRLERFFRIAGAKTFGLCDLDYGKKLANLGEDLVKRVGRLMYLSRPPVLSSIRVTYGSQIIANDTQHGWTFDPKHNALIFGQEIVWDKNQPQGTQVEVAFVAAEYN